MLIFALAIFAGAFLLFQVQPLIGKFILPPFGGGPGVWTVCMLFFQLVLLGGYAYAHLLTRLFNPRTQVVVHLTLLGASLALLPITPADSWRPDGAADPRGQILLLLASTVGLSYFALSATGPLFQQWFSRVKPGASPYRLYALSNVGSLLALLSYPIYFETHFPRKSQAGLWAWGLILFVVCSAFCARRVWNAAGSPRSTAPSLATSDPPTVASGERPTVLSRALWLLLPASASVLLLATTNKLCQDVTVVPLLWVVPLALYLLSFVICFDSPRWYRRGPFFVALGVALAGLSWTMLGGALRPIPVQLAAYLVTLFVCCLVCHGELYRLRPDSTHLTGFYLMIAAGGALGGVFVTLVAPVIFTDYFELHWGLLSCAVLALVAWMRGLEWARTAWWRWSACAGSIILIAALGATLWRQARQTAALVIHRTRNFYGVLGIWKEDPSLSSLPCVKLVHGITLHGLQILDPKLAALPTTYFGENSGVGRVLRSLTTEGRRIGVVGLGAGTLAHYAKRGDYLRLYEINSEVEQLARQYFTYLSNCPAQVEIALGDARLSFEKEPAQNFDVLVMDAFSSDAIPMHLLTQEAFTIYQRHLRPNGVVAVHISNRHLDLEPVVASIAERFNYGAVLIENRDSRDKWWLKPSLWVVLSRDPNFFRQPLIQEASRPVRIDPTRVSAWTDDFASLYPIIRFRSVSTAEPTPAEARAAIAGNLGQRGDLAGAIQQYRAALDLDPALAEALNNLAWLLAASWDASVRNGLEAVRLAERANELTGHRRTIMLGTLAAAYAEAGQFSNAVATAEKACALAKESGDEVLLAKNQELLALYRDGKPYHESPSGP